MRDVSMIKRLATCRHRACRDRRMLAAWLRVMRRAGEEIADVYAIATWDLPGAPSLDELLVHGREKRDTDDGT